MLAQRDEVQCEEKLGKVRKVGQVRKFLPYLPSPLLPYSKLLPTLAVVVPPDLLVLIATLVAY